MKKAFLLLLIASVGFYHQAKSQTYATQLMTTGDNLISTSNPNAADIVIGSSNDGGTRHDGSIMWYSSASADRISLTGDVFYLSTWNSSNPNVALATSSSATSYVQGNLLIGKTSQTNTAYKLDVAGSARANSVVVNTTGADFVFAPAYKLMPLTDLSRFLNQNHHLPNIPSAKEMQANGLNLGDNQTLLLQKVEELTLYLLEKDRQLAEQKVQLTLEAQKNHDLEERMKKLEAEMQQLLKSKS
jgi:hypothetical protein